MEFFEKERWGNPLVAQGLGLQAPAAAGAGAGTIPGLGLRPESCTTARSIERGQLPVSPRVFSRPRLVGKLLKGSSTGVP